MKHNKIINKLEAIQKLRKEYELKLDEAFNKDHHDEISRITKELKQINEKILQLEEIEKTEISSNAVYSFLINNIFDYDNFLDDLKLIVEKYFESIRYEDNSDAEENYKSIYCYFDEKSENYFRFTEDNNGLACIDINFNNIKQIAGFKSIYGIGRLEKLKSQLKNIFLDLSNNKLGVYHDYYYIEE